MLLALFGVGACGFKPIYGSGGVGEGLQGRVRFQLPDTIIGFQMRGVLEGQFGAPNDERFVVNVTVNETVRGAAVTEDGDTTRFNITGRANWGVEGRPDLAGTVQSFTSYSATGSTVATQAAERDARDRLAQILSDQLSTDLFIALSAGS